MSLAAALGALSALAALRRCMALFRSNRPAAPGASSRPSGGSSGIEEPDRLLDPAAFLAGIVDSRGDASRRIARGPRSAGRPRRRPRGPRLVRALGRRSRVIATMYGRAGGQRDVDAAAQILGERGEAIGEALVSHRFPLAKAADAFETARDRTAGAIKVVLEP